MARQNIVAGNAWDDSNGRGLGFFTNFEQIGVGDQGSYISPYQRSDHVIDIGTMPFQRSLTSPLDVAGNWNSTVVEAAQGGVEVFQDPAGGDLEDANLLLAGAANLLTTRSDTFVAHFRVRSFRQNAETGVWDATDPNYIVDERRFVMLVDRSAVDTPNDRPDVLFLEEAPK